MGGPVSLLHKGVGNTQVYRTFIPQSEKIANRKSVWVLQSTYKSSHLGTERWPLSGEGVMERELFLKMKQTDSVGEVEEREVKICPHG